MTGSGCAGFGTVLVRSLETGYGLLLIDYMRDMHSSLPLTTNKSHEHGSGDTIETLTCPLTIHKLLSGLFNVDQIRRSRTSGDAWLDYLEPSLSP